MTRTLRVLVALIAAGALATAGGAAFAQPKGKDKEQSEGKGKKDKPEKVKQHKHQNGKNLVGEKIKKNGTHKFHEQGKHTAYVDVRDGKIAGVKVKHAEKGDVPVKKYKTTKKMVDAPTDGIRLVSLDLAQAQYLGTPWIGYAYIDDWGDEVIYWFPYDMIYDGDTGAIEYIPAY